MGWPLLHYENGCIEVIGEDWTSASVRLFLLLFVEVSSCEAEANVEPRSDVVISPKVKGRDICRGRVSQ